MASRTLLQTYIRTTSHRNFLLTISCSTLIPHRVSQNTTQLPNSPTASMESQGRHWCQSPKSCRGRLSSSQVWGIWSLWAIMTQETRCAFCISLLCIKTEDHEILVWEEWDLCSLLYSDFISAVLHLRREPFTGGEEESKWFLAGIKHPSVRYQVECPCWGRSDFRRLLALLLEGFPGNALLDIWIRNQLRTKCCLLVFD